MERLTLQTFETLFEQLRYDDAEKFVNSKQKDVFIATLMDGSDYVMYARDKVAATRKLVSMLNESLKIRYIIKYCYTSHWVKSCNICSKVLQDGKTHYLSHTESEINEYLLQFNWFEQGDRTTVIEC